MNKLAFHQSTTRGFSADNNIKAKDFARSDNAQIQQQELNNEHQVTREHVQNNPMSKNSYRSQYQTRNSSGGGDTASSEATQESKEIIELNQFLVITLQNEKSLLGSDSSRPFLFAVP